VMFKACHLAKRILELNALATGGSGVRRHPR
jgi:hypothetical protein